MRDGSNWKCPRCRRWYGDPLFHGPAGHAPARMCFDCWASEWGLMAIIIAQCGEWRHLDAALFLLCQGFTQQEAADVIGVRRSEVCHWIRRLRRHPDEVPEWLLRLHAGRGLTGDGEFVSWGPGRRG